ncbi:MAG: hypothetical protein JO117_10505 [Verrucomicrobia bacterium]|nr:hypothetical protein [Verrucomicrobiota bacterium]MBV9657589.1 hypothetical protein [Verrucomicrobiota bacterium]
MLAGELHLPGDPLPLLMTSLHASGSARARVCHGQGRLAEASGSFFYAA